MQQRVSLIALGVLDLARAKRLYEALDWETTYDRDVIFFQAGGHNPFWTIADNGSVSPG